MPSEDHLYALQNLAAHLAGDRQAERLGLLLGKLEFLQAKLGACGVPALIADYDFLPAGSPLRSAQAALRLAAQALEGDPAQLAGQLLGRLPAAAPHPALARLISAAQAAGEDQLRPVTSSLSPAGGALRQSFRLPGGARGLAVTSKGHVLSGSLRRVWIWDPSGERPPRSLSGHHHDVTAIALSPDERWLVSSDQQGTLHVWDFESGRLSRGWRGHEGWVSHVVAMPDGERFLSAGWEGVVKLWDRRQGTELHVFRGHTKEVASLVITPDGTRAVSSAQDGAILIWDLAARTPPRVLWEHPGRRGVSLALSGDGRRLISDTLTGKVLIWDLPAGTVIRELPVQSDFTRLAISPDGRQLAVQGSALEIWDLASESEARTLATGRSAGTMAFTPDGTRLVTAGAGLRVWDPAATPALRSTVDIGALAITPDGLFAVIGSADGTIAVWDLAGCRELRRFPGSDFALQALALTPDGSQVFAGDRKGGLRRFALASGERLPGPEGFETDNAVRTLAVTGDGRHLVAGSIWGDVLVWDLEERRLICERRIEPGYLNALALIPGTLQAIVGLHHEDDQSPFILDLRDGRVIRRLRGDGDDSFAVFAVAVAADASFAVTGSEDHNLKIWSLTGRGVRTLRGHGDAVRSVALTADGRYAVSASSDRTVRLWDLESRRCLARFTADSGLQRCAVTPDGRTIVASGAAGELHFLRRGGQGSAS